MTKTTILAGCLAIAGWAVVQSTGVGARALYESELTFSKPVSLPGVGLGAGTYVFEHTVEGVPDLVRVRTRNGRVFLTAFADRVGRPAGLPRRVTVSFGEAPSSMPQPITTWWPDGADHGFKFRYPGVP